MGKTVAALVLLASAICSRAPDHGVQKALAGVTLYVAEQSFTPGKPLEIAIVIDLAEHWHTYWINPGDAGMAPKIEWDMPRGWTELPVRFPAPSRFMFEGLVSFGYENRAVILGAVIPGDGLQRDSAKITVRTTILVCKESCIPVRDTATVRLAIRRGQAVSAIHDETKRLFDEARRKLPRMDHSVTAYYSVLEDRLTITVPRDSVTSPLRELTFFPQTRGVFDYAADQAVSRDSDHIAVDCALSPLYTGEASDIKGLLVGYNRQADQVVALPIRAIPESNLSLGGSK